MVRPCALTSGSYSPMNGWACWCVKKRVNGLEVCDGNTQKWKQKEALKPEEDKMNDMDLRGFLENWPYDPEMNVRLGRGCDGQEIVLVRKPLGLEQYEADGHPGGWHEHGTETVLNFHQTRFNGLKLGSPDSAFDLTAEDCTEIFQEAAAYYHRLIALFRLKEWRRVERDAMHILRLLDFVELHARCAEDRLQLASWRPLTTRIKATAWAMSHLEKGRYQEALTAAGDIPGISTALDDSAPGCKNLADLLSASVRGSLTDCPKSPSE